MQSSWTEEALGRARLATRDANNRVQEMVAELDNPTMQADPSVAGLRQSLSQKALDLFEGYLKEDSAFPEVRQDTGDTLLFIGYIHRARHERDKTQEAFHRAIDVYERLAADYPNNASYSNSAGQGHHILALELNVTGAPEQVTEECRLAARAYERALQLEPDNPDSLNYSAWFLSICPDPAFRDPGRAVQLAERLTRAHPELASGWNDLGAARYRDQNWQGAVDAMLNAIAKREAQGAEGTGQDMIFLAMAYRRLGMIAESDRWFDKAVRWSNTNAPDDAEMYMFRQEAEQLGCRRP